MFALGQVRMRNLFRLWHVCFASGIEKREASSCPLVVFSTVPYFLLLFLFGSLDRRDNRCARAGGARGSRLFFSCVYPLTLASTCSRGSAR